MQRNVPRVSVILLLMLTFSLAACAGQTMTEIQPGEIVEERITSEEGDFRLVRVASFDRAWGMDFLPDGRMLVAERSGTMYLLSNGEAVPVSGLPEVQPQGQGGLLDVRLHPNYGSNGWIYFSYSAPGDGGVGTAVSRARLDGNTFVDVETLFSLEPKTTAGAHFGSRILFLDDGTFLFTIGDRGNGPRAQDPSDPAGSTLRIADDGSIPADNPFVNREGYAPELYTLGNRNIQGIDRHPQTGVVWATEHGPRGGDELNRIEPGLNFGWPEASWGHDYRTGEQIGVPHDQAPQFEQPVYYWTPAIAPSGLAFYSGNAFPNWQNNLFVGSLVQSKVIRVVMDGDAVTHQEDLLTERIGRIRDVRQGPDGFLYILTDEGDGGLYRLEPAE
jgi:aldose sugar dehydrogenase